MSVEPKAQLLERVVRHLAEAGIGDRSLRQIAAGSGTSHRMLIYHFGSRDGVLVEVARAMERRQRAELAELRKAGGTPREIAWRFWRKLSDPALAPYERLFFELYGVALGGSRPTRPFLDGIVEQWLEPIGELLAPGLPADDPDRRAAARQALAFVRGALLDLLTTGERPEVDHMVAGFIERLTSAP